MSTTHEKVKSFCQFQVLGVVDVAAVFVVDVAFVVVR